MSSLPAPRRWAYRAYRALPGPVHRLGEAALRMRAEREVAAQPWFGDVPVRLLVGPLNTAGQATAWARSFGHGQDRQGMSLSLERRSRAASQLAYRTDIHLSLRAQWHGGVAWRRRVLGESSAPVTLALVESGFPILGDFYSSSILDDLPDLSRAGVRTALLIHGSEMRDLHVHAGQTPYSPFRGLWTPDWARMETRVQRTRALVDNFPGPVLVPTVDMLAHVPGAALLPITIDTTRFETARPCLERDIPVVLHAPTNPALKGTVELESAMQKLHDEGLLRYRRLQGVPNERMPTALAEADVVVDQLVLGNVATLAAEAMAAGRLVVAHVPQEVRRRMTEIDGRGVDPPIVEANPFSVAEVVRDVMARRSVYQHIAAQGPEWARRHHDGARAAAVLSEWLG